MFELGDSVYVGEFTGFISEFFFLAGEKWAKVVNFAETTYTTQKVEFLTHIS